MHPTYVITKIGKVLFTMVIVVADLCTVTTPDSTLRNSCRSSDDQCRSLDQIARAPTKGLQNSRDGWCSASVKEALANVVKGYSNAYASSLTNTFSQAQSFSKALSISLSLRIAPTLEPPVGIPVPMIMDGDRAILYLKTQRRKVAQH
ncbi:hypothetical protein LguiB_026653 [Lonicera macranthoides]